MVSMFSVFTQFIGALALIGGLIFGALAFMEPYKYNLGSASAVQVAQVYAQATYYGVMSLVLFAFAITLQVAIIAARRAA